MLLAYSARNRSAAVRIPMVNASPKSKRIEFRSPDPAANFTVTATYQNADEELNRCGTFTIDGRGTKTSGPWNDCWTRQR